MWGEGGGRGVRRNVLIWGGGGRKPGVNRMDKIIYHSLTPLFYLQGCDRSSEDKHALSHNKSNPSHNIVVHLQNWVVW